MDGMGRYAKQIGDLDFAEALKQSTHDLQLPLSQWDGAGDLRPALLGNRSWLRGLRGSARI
jgi:hypothetical protein